MIALRTLMFLAGISLTLAGSARADCPGDCNEQFNICYGSWNAWDAVCQTTAYARWDAGWSNCTYNCFDPCVPDLCNAANDADYNDATDFCDETVWDGIDGCDEDLVECLAQCP